MPNDTQRAVGLKLQALAQDLPAAMTAATGDAWSLHPDPWPWTVRNDDFAADDPAGVRGFWMHRPDGFGLTIWGNQWLNTDLTRMTAKVLWPVDPLADAARTYGTRYHVAGFESGFSVDRPAKAIAGQLVRALVTPEAVAKWGELAAKAAKAIASRDAATGDAWRELVGEAIGKPWELATNGAVGYFGASRYTHWAGIELDSRDGLYPGGKLELRLPDDPEKAAALVRAIRRAADEVA